MILSIDEVGEGDDSSAAAPASEPDAAEPATSLAAASGPTSNYVATENQVRDKVATAPPGN